MAEFESLGLYGIGASQTIPIESCFGKQHCVDTHNGDDEVVIDRRYCVNKRLREVAVWQAIKQLYSWR
jgi:hypothetical protein